MHKHYYQACKAWLAFRNGLN